MREVSRRMGLMLTAMLCTATSAGAQAPPVQRTPIVVGIVVEGLTEDYLTMLRPQLSEGGFKRLMHSGITMTDVNFGPGIDPTAATAIVYTGASPSVNGIPARLVYDQETHLALPTLLDKEKIGNFTDETYSPKAIRVSTISDEVRIDSEGDGYVYALAADPQQAIISAGHAANGAYWITDHTGNWASTTYYRDMPAAVSNRNYSTPLKSRIDTMKWTPMFDMASYPMLSRGEKSRPFRKNFPVKDINRYRHFKSSPLGNKEITDMAIDLMTSTAMGRDRQTDMLCLAYNLSPSGATRAEVMDAYLRLDRDLARLFSAVDRVAGHGNASIFLTGLPTDRGVAPDDPRWQIPHGEFSVKRATYLLEMYLMALHGNADWVTGYHNRHIYLNRKLITDRNMSLADFRTEVADFMARMSGVSGVYTIDDIIASRAGDNPQATKRNTSIAHCGDVIIEINPGWEIVDDESAPPGRTPAVERASATRIPAFILAPGVSAIQIDTPVDARALAPAVTGVLRIRAPNAASTNAINIR